MIPKKSYSLIGTVIWLICAFFYMYEFLLRTVLGTFEHFVIADLQLTLVKFAILSSTAYLFIYALMQLPIGLITDRFGLKKTLLFGVVVCLISAVGFGTSYGFKEAIIFRMLMGLGSSAGFVCLLVAVYDWMPRKNIALYIGLSQFIGTLGPMLAAGPLNSLSTELEFSWRYIFWILGVLGVILALLVGIFVKNNKDKAGRFEILKLPGSAKNSLLELIKQPQVWYIIIYSACSYFTIEYLSENTGKAFLVLVGYKQTIASYLITISWIGFAIACPVFGWISDKVQRRKPVMLIASVFGLIGVSVIFYFPYDFIIVSIAFFFLGVGGSGQSIGFAIMAEQCKQRYLASGMGLNNAVIVLLASVNAPLIGWVLSVLSGGHKMSVLNYQYASSILIFFMLVGLMCLFFIKETFCKSVQEATKVTVG